MGLNICKNLFIEHEKKNANFQNRDLCKPVNDFFRRTGKEYLVERIYGKFSAKIM